MDNKLFVRSLSWDTNNDTLRTLFETIGEVEEAVVIFDKATGRSKGFGFVTFKTEEDAARAIEELDGKELDGRVIYVSVARPKAE